MGIVGYVHADEGAKRWSSYGHALAFRLRTIRRLRGMSQEELAAKSGISRNSISNLERNENNSGKPVDPRISTIYGLALALDVPPMALMPAAGQPVASICVDETLAIDIRWPSESEKMLFDADPHSATSSEPAELKDAKHED